MTNLLTAVGSICKRCDSYVGIDTKVKWITVEVKENGVEEPGLCQRCHKELKASHG